MSLKNPNCLILIIESLCVFSEAETVIM